MCENTGTLYDASMYVKSPPTCCRFNPYQPEEVGEFSLPMVAFLLS